MDSLLKDYKTTKQIMLKKLKNKENFWKAKENFIKNSSDEESNKIFTSIPTFNNITNVINSIPNPINSNITHFTNFAGSLGSTLKNTIYNQLNLDNQTNKINIEEKSKEECKIF
jgi:phage-related protein